jgi:diketogulonate reductase-like aldo/keto reductase
MFLKVIKSYLFTPLGSNKRTNRDFYRRAVSAKIKLEKNNRNGGKMMEYVNLNNGIKMPILGYGVYQVSNEECERCVLDAISVGYRSIDTAQAYGNEEAVGNAIRKCGVPREELFITTKVWISNGGYEKAKESLRDSLQKLQTEYIDLVLIHQPFNDYYGTYRAMEEAYKEGWIRAIGVSNFYPDRFIDLCQYVEVKPAINQIETHVFQQQKIAHQYMEKYGVQHESWGPFAEGRKDFFTNPVLTEIGAKHGKTAAQTALRFLIQSNVIVIPKSTHKERMIQNFDVFDFTLDDADMSEIQALDEGESLFFSHYDPATVEMLTGLHR